MSPKTLFCVLSLILTQLYVVNSARRLPISDRSLSALWDEAQQLLSVLETSVQKSIDDGVVKLNNVQKSIVTQGESSANNAQAKIQDTYQKLVSQLNELKDLTSEAGINATSCTSNVDLSAIPQIYLNNVTACIKTKVGNAESTINGAVGRVKNTNNAVVDLGNKLIGCGITGTTCLAEVIGELTTQIVDLPYQIGINVKEAQINSDTSQLAIDACGIQNIALFAINGTGIVEEASKCVYDEIHSA